jgi:N-acetylglutamate synthase-like GNAT family acetyltransferase
MVLSPVTPSDVDDVRAFLVEADLTLAGLDAEGVRLWIDRGDDGAIVGSTGFELSRNGKEALIRSVAVSGRRRAGGQGTQLARFALAKAASAGATRAWLFSRRSGPFWQKLGFVPADRYELAAVLPEAEQVRLFVKSGQLEREVAWARDLATVSQ